MSAVDDATNPEASPPRVEQTQASAQPRVWVLVGEKRGDNAQVRNLAQAVGWDFEEKHVQMKTEWREGKPPVAASLGHVDLVASDSLEGPWPELVLLAGRRLASVALWIKAASKGQTRLVVVGKPRGKASAFDLIVIAAHYVMPDAPNVARHALPLMNVDRDALAETKKAWVGRLLLLPRPLSALFVGGPTGGLRFDVETAKELLAGARAAVLPRRGSLYIVTSRRTPAAVADYLAAERTPNEQIFLYGRPGEGGPGYDENPYQGLLALAEHFIVTTDSLSMMVEVAKLGRLLSLYPVARATPGLEGVLTRLGVMKTLSPRADEIPAGGLAARTVAALGWPMHSRDLTAISRLLVEKHLASWLGEPVVQPEPYEDDALSQVAQRIRGLVSP